MFIADFHDFLFFRPYIGHNNIVKNRLLQFSFKECFCEVVTIIWIFWAIYIILSKAICKLDELDTRQLIDESVDFFNDGLLGFDQVRLSSAFQFLNKSIVVQHDLCHRWIVSILFSLVHVPEIIQALLLQIAHILFVFFLVNCSLHELDVLLKLFKIFLCCLDQLVLGEKFQNIVNLFYFWLFEQSNFTCKVVLVLLNLLPDSIDDFIASQLFIFKHFVEISKLLVTQRNN